jgi:hypothetical protein
MPADSLSVVNVVAADIVIINWKMRNSNTNLQREYYNDLSRSRYSSQTSRKLKSLQRDDFNDTKTVPIPTIRGFLPASTRPAQP